MHTQPPLKPFCVPGRHFDHVHVRPLPRSQGFTHLLTGVNCITRWPEVVHLASMTAEVVARALVSTWVLRFGTPPPPIDITLDRGPQFVSELWSTMAVGGWGRDVKVHRTTTYHP